MPLRRYFLPSTSRESPSITVCPAAGKATRRAMTTQASRATANCSIFLKRSPAGTQPVELGGDLQESGELGAGEPLAQRALCNSQRIDRPAVASELEMQMRTGGQAGAAHEANHLTLTHAHA